MPVPDPFYNIESEFEITLSAGDTGAIPFIMPDEIDLDVFTYARFQLIDRTKTVVVDKTTTDGTIVYDDGDIYVVFEYGDTVGFSGTYQAELHLRTTDLASKKTISRG